MSSIHESILPKYFLFRVQLQRGPLPFCVCFIVFIQLPRQLCAPRACIYLYAHIFKAAHVLCSNFSYTSELKGPFRKSTAVPGFLRK